MAIRSLQLVGRRPAVRTPDQRVRPGPVRLSADYDVLHGLADYYNFYPRLRAVLTDPGLG